MLDSLAITKAALMRRLSRNVSSSFSAPVEIGLLQGMRIHRDIPSIRKILECANVIEVPVGLNDCGGPGAVSEPLGSSGDDKRPRADHSGVDQDPLPVAGLRSTIKD